MTHFSFKKNIYIIYKVKLCKMQHEIVQFECLNIQCTGSLSGKKKYLALFAFFKLLIKPVKPKPILAMLLCIYYYISGLVPFKTW